VPVLAVIAVISMVLGNLAAIVQSSVRRLLAYSAIAHGGYMLLAVMTSGGLSLASLVYYAITYGLTAVGAFGVVSLVQEWTGGDRLSDFAGLSRRAPALSFCMMVFMLSLAGIPPLAGFFGKFYIFSAALSAPNGSNLLWLIVMALAMSAVSLYYYLQVLKQIYVAEASTQGTASRAPVIGQIVVAVIACAVLGLGCAPEWLIEKLNGVLQLSSL
jgi:NADH-quinone oxidoreductase subunit N